METRKIQHFFLPAPIAFHIKTIAGCALFAFAFAWFRNTPYFKELFYICFALMVVQFELYFWIAKIFFGTKTIKSLKEFNSTGIYKLLLFYLMILVFSATIFTGVMTFTFLIKGLDLKMLFHHILSNEIKGFMSFYSVGILIGTIVYFFIQWKEALIREQKLKEETLIFQYETLKNQVNPHFLFNSLNTLSSLVNTTSDLAEQFIQKLSSIYRYVLENTNVEQIDLQKEIDFVNDYFFLQKIRDNGKISLNIQLMHPEKYRILPMSLQLLVENAVKHNAATRNTPLNIEISVTDDDYVVVRNNLQRKDTIETSSRIGLNNLGERIRFITFKEIIIQETSSEFIVKVPLINSSLK